MNLSSSQGAPNLLPVKKQDLGKCTLETKILLQQPDCKSTSRPVSYQDMAAIAKAEDIRNASGFSAIFLWHTMIVALGFHQTCTEHFTRDRNTPRSLKHQVLKKIFHKTISDIWALNFQGALQNSFNKLLDEIHRY